MVPVVRDVDQMSFADFERELGELATKAQDGSIGMDELMGTINQFVRERGPAVSNAFPEQYPMLRTLQFALCGYYRVVDS